MTDSEITKAFKNCLEMKKNKCRKCPYKNIVACAETMFDDLLDLINRQKAEIERLKKECGNQSTLWSKHYEGIFETAKETLKAEAIKEFAERLKNKLTSCSKAIDGKSEYLVCDFDIDSLVKEMVGE